MTPFPGRAKEGSLPLGGMVHSAQGASINSSAAVSFRTLLMKEMLRFWKVSFQTIAAPVLTAVLYLLVFGHVLEEHVQALPGVSYTAFLIPGLVMMSVLQNAFANSSSSLIQSKIMGSLIFILLPPLSHWQLFGAYVTRLGRARRDSRPGRVRRHSLVRAATICGAAMDRRLRTARSCNARDAGLDRRHLGRQIRSASGFQNFIVMPATFLSGVFYSVQGLPPFWRTVSHFNPFFYMIDGFRYGFFAQSDINPWLSLARSHARVRYRCGYRG